MGERPNQPSEPYDGSHNRISVYEGSLKKLLSHYIDERDIVDIVESLKLNQDEPSKDPVKRFNRIDETEKLLMRLGNYIDRLSERESVYLGTPETATMKDIYKDLKMICDYRYEHCNIAPDYTLIGLDFKKERKQRPRTFAINF